jgi:hypothetical protein
MPFDMVGEVVGVLCTRAGTDGRQTDQSAAVVFRSMPIVSY